MSLVKEVIMMNVFKCCTSCCPQSSLVCANALVETTFSGSAEQGNFQQQQNICLYIKHISILSFLILLKAEYIQVCNRSIFVRGEITSLIDIAGMVRGVKSC